jgi:hypothetical protein
LPPTIMPYAGDLKPLRVVGETLCPTIELATAVESFAHLDKIAVGGGVAGSPEWARDLSSPH